MEIYSDSTFKLLDFDRVFIINESRFVGYYKKHRISISIDFLDKNKPFLIDVEDENHNYILEETKCLLNIIDAISYALKKCNLICPKA